MLLFSPYDFNIPRRENWCRSRRPCQYGVCGSVHYVIQTGLRAADDCCDWYRIQLVVQTDGVPVQLKDPLYVVAIQTELRSKVSAPLKGN